jgi:hypothetical protein
MGVEDHWIPETESIGIGTDDFHPLPQNQDL